MPNPLNVIMKDLHEDMKSEVREILTINSVMYDKANMLAKFQEEDLNAARVFLHKNKKRPGLEKRIEKELQARIDARMSVSNKSPELKKWFAPRWEAVRALFGKGTANLKDKETKKYLDSINPAWGEKYKGY